MTSWGAFAKVAKSTLTAAQKKIDAVLDIHETGGQAEITGDESLSNVDATEDQTENDRSNTTKPLHKLQEDFFTAFGFSSGSAEPSQSSNVASTSKSRDDTTLKAPWKALISTFTGSPSEAQPPEHPSSEHGIITSSNDAISETLPISGMENRRGSSTLAEYAAPICDDTLPLSLDTSASLSMENQSQDILISPGDTRDSHGWSTETLVVPSKLTAITNFDNSDFLSPADASPFFNADAHLSFVGEEEQEDVVTPLVELIPGLTFPEQHPIVTENLITSLGPATQLIDSNLLLQPADLVEQESRSSSLLSTKASTSSSCATTDTVSSVDSFMTVIQTETSQFPRTDSVHTPLSLSNSSTEKNLSSVFADSTITSSTDSNEKSVTTIMDNGDDENHIGDTGDDQPSDNEDIETNIGAMFQDEGASSKGSLHDGEECIIEDSVTSPNLLTVEHTTDPEHRQEIPADSDDVGMEMRSITPNLVHNSARGSHTDIVINEEEILPGNITESFVQLSRNDSNNEGGGSDSNVGSDRSPTQPATCGKSSGDASADELCDDAEVEAATTCSDIEIISTPPYDTVSERSSRSGVVSRLPEDWNYQPSSKLFHAYKDNSTQRRSHRRAGSDQSLASCESVPAASYAASAISRSASFTVQDYEKKFSHLTELLEARERKLLDIAKENAQLADENEQLRNELQQLHSRISRDANIDAVQRELSERLNTVERKYDTVSKERDALKRKCDNLEKEVASRVTVQQFKEKEEQIAELMAEGEKLSKQELKQSNVIKKLREKEKDSEKQVENMKNKLKDMDDLKQKLKEKDEQEIKYDEMVHELRNTVNRQEKTISKLRSELEDAKDKCTSYKATLENCAREIAELNQEKAIKDAEIQRLLNKAAESKETELQTTLDQAQQEWQAERQSLLREVQCLRMSSSQDMDDFQRREQSLRWEITQLHKKVQETEDRNQELAESITTATKPLLRQLDSMQLSFRTQQINWERVEKSLYERINEAERTASCAVEKEREAQLIATEMRTRLVNLEAQLASLTKEKQKLEAALTASHREAESVETLRARYAADLQSEKSLHLQAVQAISKEKELISSQFESERKSLKSQYDKGIADLNEKLNEKEQMIVSLRQQLATSQDTMQRSALPPSTPLSQPLAVRISSESSPPLRGDKFSRTPSTTSFVQEDSQQSYYDTWPNDAAAGGYATLLERLRSRLQQREGELSVIKDELRSVQQNRDALAMQLIALSNNNCELEQRVQHLESVQQQYKELDDKYQALLQLYGEQIERNEELQLDLQDVKAVYKEQLDTLLKRPLT